MKKYIALLRGINVSGKNKISMDKLKSEFMKLGFLEVETYFNSGNVIFLSPINNVDDLQFKINNMIKKRFDMNIPVHVLLQKELKEIIDHAPDWWGNNDKESYDNLIFMLHPLTYEIFFGIMNDVNAEYEKAENYKEVIFWSFSRENYKKTNWWSKTAKNPIKDRITIRTANTIKKILSM